MIYYYIRERIRVTLLIFICIFIFLIVCYLYQVNLESLIYAVKLNLFLISIVFVYDFYQFFRKHMKLQGCLKRIDIKLDELPKSNGLIESDYKNIIYKLHENNVSLKNDFNINRSEMIDYYTMWVHQIKTPISAMNMILQSMEFSEYKKIMNEEVFKIEQYVEMVLHYIRLESMSCDLQFKEYNLNNILHDVIKKYSLIFINKKISLDFKEIDYSVVTDEKWLAFVLEQLLSNALKYTNEGNISIYIEKDSLVIKDTGIGIDEEDIKRVFERGFTGYNGRRDKKSTGIGLYLCKKILNKLSSDIYIKSEVNRGTEVKIDFSRKGTNF